MLALYGFLLILCGVGLIYLCCKFVRNREAWVAEYPEDQRDWHIEHEWVMVDLISLGYVLMIVGMVCVLGFLIEVL